MFCKFHRENPKNLQRHRVRAIEKRRVHRMLTINQAENSVLSK